MAWKLMVRVKGETEFVGNGLVFATMEEAHEYGEDLYSRWMAVEQIRSTFVDEKPNYRWDGKLISLERRIEE